MKKLISLLILLFFVVLLSSCTRSYRVTFNLYEGESKYEIVEKEGKITPFTPQREGYKFSCFLYKDEVFDLNTPILDNITLTAEWIREEYEVKFFVFNEEFKTTKIEYGEVLKEIEEKPERDDYLFLGWYKDDEEYDFLSKVTSNLTLSAKMVKDSEYKIKLVISFNSTGAKIKYDDIEINRLDEINNLPTPIFEGHEFLGWYINDKKIENGDIIREIEDFTLIAKWK